MLETWLSNERLLSNSPPRFLTDDEESREQPSSVRQCSRLLLVWFLGPILNTSVFFSEFSIELSIISITVKANPMFPDEKIRKLLLLQGRMTPFSSRQFLALAHMILLESCTTAHMWVVYLGLLGCVCWMLVKPQSRESFAKVSLYLCRSSLNPWRSTSLWRASASLRIC